MKDAFQSDDSYLILTEEIREEKIIGEALHNRTESNPKGSANGIINSEEAKTDLKSKKISKRNKGFNWKLMWVKQ